MPSLEMGTNEGDCPRLDFDVLIALLARRDLSRTDVRVYLALAVLTVGRGLAQTSLDSHATLLT